MNKKQNHKNINLIHGELIEAKDQLENFINFNKRWQDHMNQLKEIPLSRDQVLIIANHFIDEIGYISISDDHCQLNEVCFFNQLNNDLFIALTISINKYEEIHKSFWNHFKQKFKMPSINVNIGNRGR